jgi:hypothetical protein
MQTRASGATDMIGGHAALYLRSSDREVNVAGRTRPAAGTPLDEAARALATPEPR